MIAAAEAFSGPALAACALATLALAELCDRWRLGDRPDERSRARKRQGRPVPPVGGLAFGIALALTGGAEWLETRAPGAGTAFVFVVIVGAVDDFRPGGLRPGTKLVLQALALLPLALAGGASGAGIAVLALGAVNVLNTFDNADGAAAGVGALGLAATSPYGLALVLGFLPFNLDAGLRLDARGAARARRGEPTAYLGDAGAYALALWLALDPLALVALWIPLLDLARLCVVRLRAGSRPWIGDRRHLAHRLQERVPSPRWLVVVLLGIAAPAVVGAHLESRLGGATALGLVASTALFALALWMAPQGVVAQDRPVGRGA